MSFLKTLVTGLAILAAMPVLAAETITVTDAYARFLPGAKAGAAFMAISNSGAEADQLTGAASDAAMRVELHTHKAGEGGMMQMLHVPEGFTIPANGQHVLARGGDHVMFMGPTRDLTEGDVVTVTLTFAGAGDVTVAIPVDNSR